MLSKTKFRRKAKRIAISEIMIPIILIIVLGITIIVFIIKLSTYPSEELFLPEERVEIKWIINLGLVMIYSSIDLLAAYLLYTGIREVFFMHRGYRKCYAWVYIQIIVLIIFTIVMMKRCNATVGGFHFFEFIVLCVCIYIYKIHHVTFVYGLLESLKIDEENLKKISHKQILKAEEKLFRKMSIAVTKAKKMEELQPRPIINEIEKRIEVEERVTSL